MKFRDVKQSDLRAIREINSQAAHQYDLDSPEFVLGGVAVNDKDEVVGFGAVKVIYECFLILDQTKSRKTRIEAARELIRNGIEQSKDKGIQYWHAFCDTDFALFLERWFNFIPADGRALVLSIDGGRRVEKRRETNEGEVGGGPILGKEQVRSYNPGTGSRTRGR